ncbi:carboxymuconolactone decarboxylase family protein [Kingella sp. SNUBH-2017]|uniref:cupin domain-containing carboxymuconolactone decarboxylase family protein n=1 Tax=Kingella sp. SNUBH-2017 TaxID=2994077 RepID=UPI002363466C|nr:carboxymuconolactone decarboxylase family protein [Kingella sp. SNUBH-2017]MDD2182120.1 carboxymuconolactone decarboxylase family protein [Kingella sp. SNUBH-2017]
MKKFFQKTTALCFALAAPFVQAQTMTQVIPQSVQTVQTTDPAHFTGQGSYARLPVMPSNGDVAAASVNFPPNVFTDWHSHAQGQYLIVTEGVGRFQEWGKPVQTIQKGDVVWIAPNVKHWHGAGEFTAMAHIALSPAKDNAVTWFEKVNLPRTERVAAHISGSLKAKQLALLPVAAAVTTGDTAKLNAAVAQGLADGLTVSELTEAVSHQFAYIGAPKTLNGIAALQKQLETRKNQGIRDPEGTPATDIGAADYYQLGTQTLARLSQAPTDRPIFRFAPAVDYAIKAQLFGYQFSRDNLGAVERELVTLASLAALGESVNGQMRSHLRVLQNLGATDRHIAQIAQSIETALGKAAADNVRQVWQGLD